MKNINIQENGENPSTKQSNDQQNIAEQLDASEWAMLNDETCVGFAVREGF